MALAEETELRKWLDRLAIQEILYRYSDAVTRADWEQCEADSLPTRCGRARRWGPASKIAPRSSRC
jgi:hypothetical protein